MKQPKRYLNMHRLKENPDAAVVIHCMWLWNDIFFLQHIQEQVSDTSSHPSEEVRHGCSLYVFRLQQSHLREGMRVIAGIEQRPNLIKVLKRNKEAWKAFVRLRTENHKRKESPVVAYLDFVRNKGTFHYADADPIHSALHEAFENGRIKSLLQSFHKPFPPRYVLADAVWSQAFETFILHRCGGNRERSNEDIQKVNALTNDLSLVCDTIILDALAETKS